jgi:type IV pilus assembly protein PilF
MKQALALLILLSLVSCASVPPGGAGAAAESAPTGSDLNRAKVHTELGAGYYSRGQYGVALNELNIALAAESSYAPAYNILGLVRAELREDKEAEEAFRRAISIQPQYAEALNNYGLFLCQRGRVEDALARFESALSNPLYSTPEKALSNAGACALSKGDLAKAEVYYMRALRRAPNLGNALLGMAEVDFRSQRLLAARGKLRQLSNGEAMNAQALWLGVRVERALGDRVAENSYGAQLQRRFPEAMQTQWLIMGQYDQTGGLL